MERALSAEQVAKFIKSWYINSFIITHYSEEEIISLVHKWNTEQEALNQQDYDYEREA